MGFRKTGDATSLGRVDVNKDFASLKPETIKLSEDELTKLAELMNDEAEPSPQLREAIKHIKSGR